MVIENEYVDWCTVLSVEPQAYDASIEPEPPPHPGFGLLFVEPNDDANSGDDEDSEEYTLVATDLESQRRFVATLRSWWDERLGILPCPVDSIPFQAYPQRIHGWALGWPETFDGEVWNGTPILKVEID
jgi:hypothetical protein